MNFGDIFYRSRYMHLVGENLKLQEHLTAQAVELRETRERLDRAQAETKDALKRVADVFAARCGFGEVFSEIGSVPRPEPPKHTGERIAPLTAREVQRTLMNDFFEQLAAESQNVATGSEIED